jgi:3-oxoacyl-(acyl-carrier-protein) synthase
LHSLGVASARSCLSQAMALRLAPLLAFLAAAGASSHGDVAGTVANTSQVIGKLRETAAAAVKRCGTATEVERQLDEAGQQAKEGFDTEGYKQQLDEYAKLSRQASEKASNCLSTSNASVAEELSDEAEEALRRMTKVGFQIDAMQKTLHEELQAALDAKLRPELATADKFHSDAAALQAKSHSLYDPMYSWGDAAEDQADRLSDHTTNALSAVDKIVRVYRRQISRHAQEVQRSVERELFSDGMDRTAMWRKTNRAVRRATWHTSTLTSQAAGISSLQLGSVGGAAVLTTACASAAAIGALAMGIAASVRATQRTDYQLLAA